MRTPVPAAQGIPKQSSRVSDRAFMGIGLLGVLGPSLLSTRLATPACTHQLMDARTPSRCEPGHRPFAR